MLTEADAYPQLPTHQIFFYPFQTRFWLENATFTNKLIFFPRIQILIFHCEATQDDHLKSLYKFGMDKKILVVSGVVDMRQILLKTMFCLIIFDPSLIKIVMWIFLSCLMVQVYS